MKNSYFPIIAVTLLSLAIAGCAAPQGAIGILDMPTTYPARDKDRGTPIDARQSRLILPTKPELSAPRIFRKDFAPGRFREVYLYDLIGFIQYQRMGLIWLDARHAEGYRQFDDQQFRHLGQAISRSFTYVPFKSMTIKTRGAVKYAAFRSDNDRPCVLFSRPIGKRDGVSRANAMIVGAFCDSPRYGKDELEKLVIYYVEKIALRERGASARVSVQQKNRS